MRWAKQDTVRVALLDDHALIRNGFAARLQSERDIELVAMYSSSRKLLAQLPGMKIDVLVLDYSLQHDELDGLNLIRLLRIRFAAVRILVSSATELPAIISLSLRAGASGFIGKSQDMDELLRAVRVVASHKVYLDPAIAHELPEAMLPVPAGQAQHQGAAAVPDTPQGLAQSPALSGREQEVLRCCLEGLSVTQIANKFNRSIKTISAQKHAAFRKLGIRSDVELFKIGSAMGKP